MSTQWCYRLGHTEIGPVDFEELSNLARSGELAPDAEVRAQRGGEWIRAGSLAGLFAGPEELRDLSELSFRFDGTPSCAQSTEPKTLQEIQSLDDLEIQIVSETPQQLGMRRLPAARDTDLPPAPPNRGGRGIQDDRPPEPPPPPPRSTRDRWFCLINRVEHGPLKRTELQAMARHGRIQLDTQIKHDNDGEWIAAAEIAELFPDLDSCEGTGKTERPRPKNRKRSHSSRPSALRQLTLLVVRRQTLFIALMILLPIAVFGMAIFSRVREGSDKDFVDRTQAILSRHQALKDAGNPVRKRQQLIEDAAALQSEIVPILERTASKRRPLRQHLLIAVRDHMLPMLRVKLDDASLHEDAFVENLKQARRLLTDPNLRWHVEPTTESKAKADQ
jgi:GYF domain 2